MALAGALSMISATFDHIDALAQALRVHEQRHTTIATNIANSETPGYRARDLDFASALKDAVAATSPQENSSRSARVVEDRTIPPKPDGNTVGLDSQMAKLSENSFASLTLFRFVRDEFEELKLAIDGK
jgi:flagellar basal-body rod protein FlgB